jgi:peptidoglycan/LPS O-acetylase OafA/YrhL
MVATATAREPAAAVPEVRSRYRPHLDGLRAVAVFLVVAFHAGLKGFGGGFVGVDVFFVLSGYLVTQLLLGDLASGGRIRFQHFYARRFRRILPAAAVTLVITAIAYGAVATHFQAYDAIGDFRASFLYYANWHFIAQATNYFAPPIGASPVLHFWSLAVEEQFYLVWPLALGLLFLATRRLGARQRPTLRIVIGIVCVLSAVEAGVIARTNLTRAYYGTDTRVYQLLLGALLALTPSLFATGAQTRRIARHIAPWAFVGMLVIASSVVNFGAITRGLVVAAITATLIVALENARGGWVSGALSNSRVTYVGRISYGIYLWHWPVIVIITMQHQISSIPLFVITCALSTALAALSFGLMEHRVRLPNRLDRRAALVIAGGLAVSVLGGLVVVPRILEPRASTLVSGTPGAPAGGPRLLDWLKAANDTPESPKCVGASVDKCIVVRGTGARVLLLGDSHARMWMPAFESIARSEALTLGIAVRPVCPWQIGLEYVYAPDPAQATKCDDVKRDWYDRVIPEFDPDVVVLVSRPLDDPAGDQVSIIGSKGQKLRPRSAATEKVIADATNATVSRLRRDSRNVVIVEPVPVAPRPFDPLACLSSSPHNTAHCAYRAKLNPRAVERLYRSLAQRQGVWSLNADRLVCPTLPTCAPVIDNVIVKRDPSHLTGTFALLVAPKLRALWDAGHVLKRAPAWR